MIINIFIFISVYDTQFKKVENESKDFKNSDLVLTRYDYSSYFTIQIKLSKTNSVLIQN